MNKIPLVGKPAISAAIAVLNEGPDLEMTVASCLSAKTPISEVVVVDDCSIDPVAPRLKSFGNRVRVIRHKARLGSGPSKHRAVSECRGRLIFVLDSHTRPDWDFTEAALDAHQRHPMSVLSFASSGFTSTDGPRLRGATIQWNDAGYVEGKWVQSQSLNHCDPIVCPMGGAYAIGKDLLDAVGGYAPLLREWGHEEEWLSLRAWIMGYDCRLIGAMVRHRYEDRIVNRQAADGSHPDQHALPFNFSTVMQLVWSDMRYWQSLRWSMFSVWGQDIAAGVRRLEQQNASEIQRIKSIIDTTRTRTDAEIAGLIGPDPVFPPSLTPET